jgi:hypothetical protein
MLLIAQGVFQVTATEILKMLSFHFADPSGRAV